MTRHCGNRVLLFVAIAAAAVVSVPSAAQEWVKSGAGRTEYVADRTACVQQAQAMALSGEALDRDVFDCLQSNGWRRNTSAAVKPTYCTDKPAAISCKPGGSEESYAKDRAECLDKMLATVGNRYAIPGWWGLGGAIVATYQGNENKANLQRSQVQYMTYCLEAKGWSVELKAEAKALMSPRVALPQPAPP